jgi:hypothetical protein
VKFKIEYVGKFDGKKGKAFLFVRQIEAGSFSLSTSSKLGGVPILPSLTKPRALKPDGSPDMDIYTFVLQSRRDAAKFSEGQTVDLEV